MQMTYHKIIYLKLIILLTNVTPININNKKEDMNEKRPVSKQEKTAEWKL